MIKHIYPIADQMVDGKRVQVDLVLEWNDETVTPRLSRDRGKTTYNYLFAELTPDHIRALGFQVGDITEDKPPLELAEVVTEP